MLYLAKRLLPINLVQYVKVDTFAVITTEEVKYPGEEGTKCILHSFMITVQSVTNGNKI